MNCTDDLAPNPPRAIRPLLLRVFPVLLPLILFNYAGISAVDFGTHWDETEHLVNVQHSLQTETLLPAGGYTLDNDPRLATGYYAYPSVLYWVTLASAAPEILRHPDHVTNPALGEFVVSHSFRLRVRAVCVAISSLAILWLYLAVLRCKRSWLEAFFAAMLLCGSWEISYHSRWIAPDTIVMQFAALCLLACTCIVHCRDFKARAKWAAIAAGLAAGSKYPAALLLIAVIPAACSRGGSVRFLIQLCLIALATFLITTPGAVLQPWPFLHWLAYQHRHYGSGTHLGYTVAGHFDHLTKILIYESIVLWSHQPLLSGVLFALAPIGAVLIWRQSRPLAMVALAFPIVYIAYFSMQRVMIVRNMLIISPFIALLCARGFGAILTIQNRLARAGLVAAALAAVLFNAGFTLYAAQTIRQAGASMDFDLIGLRDFMNEHRADTAFYLSAPTLDLLRQLDPAASVPMPANPTHELIIVGSEDDNSLLQWPANTWNLTTADFGPLDVNFNYYPTWMRSRIVAIALDRARTLQVDAVQQVVRQRDAK
jgi:hypothetical protein